MFSMVVWSLWHRRNQLRIGTSTPRLNQIFTLVQQKLLDFYRAQPMWTAPSNSTPHPAACWSPPHAPTLKINYDRVVFRETNEAGIGDVVRDSEGRVIASLAEKVPLPKTVADVEAIVAARRALLFAKELNLNSFVPEGDSEIITRALQAKEQSLASFGNIIEEA